MNVKRSPRNTRLPNYPQIKGIVAGAFIVRFAEACSVPMGAGLQTIIGGHIPILTELCWRKNPAKEGVRIDDATCRRARANGPHRDFCVIDAPTEVMAGDRHGEVSPTAPLCKWNGFHKARTIFLVSPIVEIDARRAGLVSSRTGLQVCGFSAPRRPRRKPHQVKAWALYPSVFLSNFLREDVSTSPKHFSRCAPAACSNMMASKKQCGRGRLKGGPHLPSTFPLTDFRRCPPPGIEIKSTNASSAPKPGAIFSPKFCAAHQSSPQAREKKASIDFLLSALELLCSFLTAKKDAVFSGTSQSLAKPGSPRPIVSAKSPFGGAGAAQESAAVMLSHVGGHKAIHNAVRNERTRACCSRRRAYVDRERCVARGHGGKS